MNTPKVAPIIIENSNIHVDPSISNTYSTSDVRDEDLGMISPTSKKAQRVRVTIDKGGKVGIEKDEQRSEETPEPGMVATKALGHENIRRSSQMKRDRLWQKLRGVTKVVGTINAVTDDIRDYGADKNANFQEKDTWSLEKQKLSEKKWYIILPNNRYKRLWDLFTIIVLLYVALVLPLQVSFIPDGPEEGIWLYINIAVDIVFFIDIVLTFITAIRSKMGELIVDQKTISMRYLRGMFFIDLIATIPIYLLDSNTSNVNRFSKFVRLPRIFKFTKFLRLLKIIRILRLNEYWIILRNTLKVNQSVMRLSRFFFWVVLGVHVASCLWFFIASFDDFRVETWVFRRFCQSLLLMCSTQNPIDTSFNITEVITDSMTPNDDGGNFQSALYNSLYFHNDYGISERLCTNDEYLQIEGLCGQWAFNHAFTVYLDGAYWAFSTLTTVGYGDVSSYTNGERIVSVIIMIFGVSFYAFTISNLSSIMANLDTESNNYQRKVEALDEFSRENGLETSLYSRLRRYYEYSYQANANNTLTVYQKSILLKELPPKLRNEVILSIHSRTIEGIPFFKKKDVSFISEVVQALQPIEVISGEFIFRKGLYSTEMHFLLSGRAELFSEELLMPLKVMVAGSYFGEDAVMNSTRPVSVRAITACELQVWSKKSMSDILKDYPDIMRSLKKIAQERNRRLREKYEAIVAQKQLEELMNAEAEAVISPSSTASDVDVITLGNGMKRRTSFLQRSIPTLLKNDKIADTSPLFSSRRTTTTSSSITKIVEVNDDDTDNDVDVDVERLDSNKLGKDCLSKDNSGMNAMILSNTENNIRLSKLEGQLSQILLILGKMQEQVANK